MLLNLLPFHHEFRVKIEFGDLSVKLGCFGSGVAHRSLRVERDFLVGLFL